MGSLVSPITFWWELHRTCRANQGSQSRFSTAPPAGTMLGQPASRWEERRHPTPHLKRAFCLSLIRLHGHSEKKKLTDCTDNLRVVIEIFQGRSRPSIRPKLRSTSTRATTAWPFKRNTAKAVWTSGINLPKKRDTELVPPSS